MISTEEVKTAARNLTTNMVSQGYKPIALYTYTSTDGSPLYWRIRMERNGEKWVRPMRKNGKGFELKEPELLISV